MRGIAILLGFHLFGLLLQKGLHIPLPANVLGLILFTAALFLKIVKLEWVEASAQFLLKHMMLFFAPVVVGTMAFMPYIRSSWLAVVLSLVVSAFVGLIVTGGVASLLQRGERRVVTPTPGQSGEGPGL
ncbi:CidA/LrgA family protein [Paenibacillus contaminans]|uniref:CidA/LrgA family protein n=1 Tax=Paenibacillus contaminans TaxID=450362 RepID=A0A329LY01_9BACL|nr:CidA/LrgA family protein [Paenibacillus contaminans]RAV12659.1 CidA/LrgA family protein [Paenibacillus contaminans]